MMRSAHRELAVVSDLLTMMVIDSGELETHYASLDLRNVAHRTLEQSQVHAAGYGVQLGAEVSVAPVPVSGDEAKLLDAISRLVSNSVMLTAAGGQVTLRACPAEDEGVLDVVDHGPGISGPDQPLVFDRLYRTMAAKRGEVPGVGVGLTIARSIVEAHGGTLRIRESSAAGTVFRLVLPLSLDPPDVDC